MITRPRVSGAPGVDCAAAGVPSAPVIASSRASQPMAIRACGDPKAAEGAELLVGVATCANPRANAARRHTVIPAVMLSDARITRLIVVNVAALIAELSRSSL